jgi:hypothetical protein
MFAEVATPQTLASTGTSNGALSGTPQFAAECHNLPLAADDTILVLAAVGIAPQYGARTSEKYEASRAAD